MRHVILVCTGLILGIAAAFVSTASGDAGLLPRAEAQTGPGGAGQDGGGVTMGIGGSTPNQNDICWLFFKDADKKGKGRYVLCCYKVNNGQTFDLIGTREVSYDMKPAMLPTTMRSKFPPATLKKLWEKAP